MQDDRSLGQLALFKQIHLVPVHVLGSQMVEPLACPPPECLHACR